MEEVTPISLHEGLTFGKWICHYIGKGKYVCVYKMTSDRAFVLDASVDFQPNLHGWRLTKIEWASDDATAKTITVKHHPAYLPSLTYPPIIFGVTGDTETEFITIFEENEADYINGDMLRFEVDGTTDKKLWVVIYIQLLKGKLISPTPPRPVEVEVNG